MARVRGVIACSISERSGWKSAGLGCRHGHERGARGPDRGGIRGIHRIERDDLITRTRKQQGSHEQGVLRAAEHDDVVGRNRLAAACRVARGHRRAQRRAAGGLRVMRIAAAHGAHGRVDDGGRRVDVGIADA